MCDSKTMDDLRVALSRSFVFTSEIKDRPDCPAK